MSEKTLHIEPVNYQDAISDDPDRRKDAQQKMGKLLEQYGFGFWTNTQLPVHRVSILYAGGLECMEKWDEVMAKSPRQHLGMVGPTGMDEEQHPDFDPEHKMYIALDHVGNGWPSWIPGQVSAQEVFKRLYDIGVNTVRALEVHRMQEEGYLSDHLSFAQPPKSHTSARLNLYPQDVGFSRAHEDTGVVASLLWKPGLMVKQGDEYVELVGAKDGDVVVNIGASGSRFLTGYFHLSTWHHVRKMPHDRVSFVVFVHTDNEVCFPGTNEKVFDWCSERFVSRGGTEDREISKSLS
jgi:isopenicillin N synthase-like dioxygenase